MWVEINKEIFEDNSEINDLRKLITDLCYGRRYEIFIDLPYVKELPLFKNLYAENRENIEASYNKFIQENPLLNYHVSNNPNDKRDIFSLSEAITFFNLPVLILLENSDNDGYFIDALIREFKKASKKITKFKAKYWIKYEMSGGSGNFIHFIEREKKNFNGKSKFLKCFVLVDSDLEFPQPFNPKRQDLENYLKKNNIPYHILEKREIENYLPDENIQEIDKNDKFIKGYLKHLSPVQKDFIDIEKGFQNNEKSLIKNKPKVYDFYKNLKENEIEELRYGINDKFKNFKNDFPNLFEKATQEGLMERCKHQKNPDELKEILNKISQLL